MNFSKEPWREHPWNQAGLVELVPIEFLLQCCHPAPTEYTDLHFGEYCHQDTVWQDIKENGMLEPLMLRINPTDNKMRLESGNHRVRLAQKDGFTHLPVATFITHKTVFYTVNGKHTFDLTSLFIKDKLVNCNYDYQIKLSDHLTLKPAILPT